MYWGSSSGVQISSHYLPSPLIQAVKGSYLLDQFPSYLRPGTLGQELSCLESDILITCIYQISLRTFFSLIIFDSISKSSMFMMLPVIWMIIQAATKSYLQLLEKMLVMTLKTLVDSAMKMLDKFYIGEVDASSVPTERVYVPLEQPAHNPDKSSQFVINILQLLVPIMILGLAFAVKHFTKGCCC